MHINIPTPCVIGKCLFGSGIRVDIGFVDDNEFNTWNDAVCSVMFMITCVLPHI